MPPTPFSSPGYQFCTVEYLISARSSATSSTTAACSWFSSRCGAVQPSRYETCASSSQMISVRSNWPVLRSLMRKYVDSSIGQRTPLGTNTNEPSVNTAELTEDLMSSGRINQNESASSVVYYPCKKHHILYNINIEPPP